MRSARRQQPLVVHMRRAVLTMASERTGIIHTVQAGSGFDRLAGSTHPSKEATMTDSGIQSASDLLKVQFAENPEPRQPVVLLLDCSGSMQGDPIRVLNSGF